MSEPVPTADPASVEGGAQGEDGDEPALNLVLAAAVERGEWQPDEPRRQPPSFQFLTAIDHYNRYERGEWEPPAAHRPPSLLAEPELTDAPPESPAASAAAEPLSEKPRIAADPAAALERLRSLKEGTP